jgi:hypothetical protein
MPMSAKRSRARVGAVVAALALTLPSGCGGGSGAVAAISTAPTVAARDLASYDVFLLASTANSVSTADVYAIRFNPFVVDRITTDKRISSMSADGRHVVVAAGDEQIDKLAEVTGAGELQPIAGLGRPHAFTPYLSEGVLYYRDVDAHGPKDRYRFFAWNLADQTQKLLFESADNFGGAKPMMGGGITYLRADRADQDNIAIRSHTGQVTEFPLHGITSLVRPGRSLIAATLGAAGDGGGDKPEALVLLDPATGTIKRIAGLQAVGWNPDGTMLLARRIGTPTDSELVLLDPAHPDAPVRVATVPGLSIFSGSWVRGEPAVDQAG